MKLIPNLHEIDQKAVSQYGIPAEKLMETAGIQMAQAVQVACSSGQKGVIVCGPGNNGGDGFVCARKLYEAGYHSLTVIYTGQNYRHEALANLEQLMMGLPVPLVNAQSQPDLALQQIGAADFVVDALFGSGLGRPVSGLEARLVEAINGARQARCIWVLAVDLPSGIDGVSGQILGCAVQADATVTFATAKPGLYLQPGKFCTGRLSIVDIGIPAQLIEADESPYRLMTLEQVRSRLPERLANSHKYSYGNVLVIAGSQAMPGAAVLCAEAAMSAGAGLVTLAGPLAVFQQLPLMPEVMRLPLPDAVHLANASVEAIKAALLQKKFNTVLLGPGLGRDEQTVQAILELVTYLKTVDIPVVVDADGLYALSQKPFALGKQFILTPHVGEAAKLLNLESAAVSADVLQAAAQLRQAFQAQIVLKSASTVIATLSDDESETLTWITPTGNPGMATAGSGDVLSGIIAAQAAPLHAQSAPESSGQAAPLGVYLHGLAGDLAAKIYTPYAMRASCITEHLPQAFRQVMNP